MKVSAMIPSKFLKQGDIAQDTLVTVRDMKLEEVGGGDRKYILYFHELPKGMVLNTLNIRVMESIGGDDSDAWMGKQVVVYVDPTVMYAGKMTGGLRLRAVRVKTAHKRPIATEPPPAEDFEDDGQPPIPF